MNSFRLLFVLVLFGISAKAADGSAPAGRFNAAQKVEKKAGSRWTLQEWLEQKQRNQLMDLWLGMYAPSPYEFFLGGAFHSFTTKFDPPTTADKDYQSYSGSLGAYATVIGLEGQYEHNSAESYSDLSGSLNLRILGNAVQGTHLIVQYGLRTRDGDFQGSHFRVGNQFAGADLNLYLTKHFGLIGHYNSYFPNDDIDLGKVSGSREEAGLFIDFDAVRVFGNWFRDLQKNEKAGSPTTTIERSGYQTGLKFFF